MKLLAWCFTVLLSCSLAVGQNSVRSRKDLAPPETNGIWFRPAREQPARPVGGSERATFVFGVSPPSLENSR